MSITPESLFCVQNLIYRFWACIDETLDTSGPELFTPDGELVIESFRAAGPEELGRYFAGRRHLSQTKGRTTRHLVTNLRVLDAGTDHAKCQITITVFSGYGAKPISLGTPSTLCDFFFDCVRGMEGGWKLQRVEGVRIFAGDDTPDLSKAAADAKGAAQ